MKKRALAVAGASAFALGTVLAPATAAQALPANCDGQYQLHTYRTYCWGGSGDFRAAVKCYRAGSDTNYVWRYGPWRLTGSTDSVAVCRSTEDPTGGYAQRRD